MTETPGSSDDGSQMIPPPAAPAPPPAPPPLAQKYQPAAQRGRRPVRTAAGVLGAIVVIVLKLGFVFGAGHLLSGHSGPVVLGVLAVVILFGFLSRFMRF